MPDAAVAAAEAPRGTDGAREVLVRGYTVVHPMLGATLVESLRAALDAHLEAAWRGEVRERVEATGRNRWNVDVPLQRPFLDDAVLADPNVLAVVRQLLGPGVICRYYSSDTALPGSEDQPVHSDEGPLFPGAAVSLPPDSLVLDIPLVDFTEDNGPLEIWTGATQLVPDVGVIPKEPAEGGAQDLATPNQTLARALPSERLLLPAGSGLIRDARVWHRGTANRSKARRSMLAVIYSRPWRNCGLRLTRSVYDGLSESLKDLLRAAHP